MKKTSVLLFVITFSLLSRAQNVNFAQYFQNEGSLRMDVFQCGDADSSHYVFERFIIEPHFGGSKVNLIDPFNFGTNRVKVVDAQTNTLIYSRGYNTLFREWQTTPEASSMERCYEESVSVPRPIHEAYIILEIRNFNGEFEEVFSKLYEPDEIFNSTEQRYVFPFYSMSTAGNMSSSSVIVHEFGHAFAGLGDEYEEPDNPLALLYNLNVEPWEPNLTTLVDFGSKWADLVAPGTPIPTPSNSQYDNAVGAFEGGGYLTTGIYRPQRHCMMRDYYPFCAVCNRTIEAVIEAHSDSLVTATPTYLLPETSLSVRPNPATAFIDVFVSQEGCQAEIIDMNGNTVMTVHLNNNVNRIRISNLPRGMYLLRANGETRKFVKQ